MTSKDKFFSNKLLEWYEKNQRELPWRKNIRHKDYPYRVLVSEFMLQQTTVATVVPMKITTEKFQKIKLI